MFLTRVATNKPLIFYNNFFKGRLSMKFMAKQPSLTELLGRAVKLKREAERAEREAKIALRGGIGETKRKLDSISERVYTSEDPSYIMLFDNFVNAMNKGVETRVLRNRIRGLINYLESGEKYREDQRAQAMARGEVILAEGAKYLMQRDIKHGIEPITQAGYYQRIIRAAQVGKINSRRVSKRKVFVKISDLDKIVGVASGEISSERCTDNYELYKEMRKKERMTREDIANSGRIKVPRGKQRGKYFGALEGAYSRWES